MTLPKFRHKYRIPTARATWHDYTGGAYFVTICTAGKECFFGDVVNNVMQLSPLGKYTAMCMENISNHYKYAEIPLFVVMPNHVHAVAFIDSPAGESPHRRDVACNVSEPPTVGELYHRRDVARYVSTTTNKPRENNNRQMSTISPKRGSLSVVIRGIKSAVTKYANTNKIRFGWQTRFHDRIVRDQDELNRIAEYIENNPAKWNLDEYFSAGELPTVET